MIRRVMLLMLMLTTSAALGCRGVKPVVGGTEGILRVDDEYVSDIQVTVHEVDGSSFQAIGFGVTDNDGIFRLVTNGANGPLTLPPGDYRCTVESVGAPIQFPTEYAQAKSTPLKISWSGEDRELELKVTGATPVK